MSTQLVLGVAGAALLGPIGLGLTTAGTGWLIGSTIGGLPGGTKGQDTQGPRLNDLSVQSSTYGSMVPVVYGTYLVNGNVIFCPRINEVVNTEEVGGKGGPSATSTTYTYNCDIAISLCDNQIAGIRKIFSSGKLIYDQSSGADLATVVASSTRSVSFKLYLGGETQLPDPTLEAELGVGNVPAYRGVAYVVFTGLDCPNGQIPQLSFELMQSATDATGVSAGTLQVLSHDASGLSSGIQPITNVATDGRPTSIFTQIINVATLRYFFRITALGPNYLSQIANSPVLDIRHQNSGIRGNLDLPLQCVTETTTASVITGKLVIYEASGAANRAFDLNNLGVDAGGCSRVAKSGGNFCAQTTQLVTLSPAFVLFEWDSGAVKAVIVPANSSLDFLLSATHAWRVTLIAGVRWIEVLSLDDLSLLASAALPGVLGVELVDAKFAPMSNGSLGAVTLSNGGNDLTLWEIGPNAVATVVEVDTGAALNVSYLPSLFNASNAIAIKDKSIFAVKQTDIGGPNYELTPFAYNFASLVASAPSLVIIVAGICDRAGVTASQLDTSALAGTTVQGYALTSVSSARANIDPLLKAFFVDVIKTDNKIKFLPRAGLSSVATIAFDELGATDAGSDSGEPFALARTLEDELPRSLAVSYINPAADYQVGTETFRRIVTNSVNDQTMQLAVVMDANRAATIASALTFDAWAERNKRKMKVSRKYASVDAGDVVTVEYPQGRFSPKRITRASDDGATCDFELVDYDGPIYTTSAFGSAGSAGQTGISSPAPTRLAVLDIPILRDADDSPALYVVMSGLTANWNGAVLYMGVDDASLSARGAVSSSAVMGFAETALGGWTQRIMDQANTVTVTIGTGALSSAPRDDVFDKDANAALLGGEIIQFTTATYLGNNQYRLSGLLRGLRGTEGQTAGHAVGERFVMLSTAGMVRPGFDLSELNTPRKFKAVTVGLKLSSQSSVIDSNTGQGLKPFSPVNLRRSAAANDITLTWDRRTRSSVTFPANGVDVPLFQSSESYSLDVYSSSGFTAVVRTIASTTPAITYTSAQQTADGLTPGAVVNVRVYQIGAAGRGDYLQGTL